MITDTRYRHQVHQPTHFCVVGNINDLAYEGGVAISQHLQLIAQAMAAKAQF
ncbi:hypothetical protein UJ81_001919 [Salmonella enterica subsp. enterica]|nr:hypothetical protein [Salmonella enterica subsp. enterica serovar Abaetetuba]